MVLNCHCDDPQNRAWFSEFFFQSPVDRHLWVDKKRCLKRCTVFEFRFLEEGFSDWFLHKYDAALPVLLYREMEPPLLSKPLAANRQAPLSATAVTQPVTRRPEPNSRHPTPHPHLGGDMKRLDVTSTANGVGSRST